MARNRRRNVGCSVWMRFSRSRSMRSPPSLLSSQGRTALITYSAGNPANSTGIFGVLPDGAATQRLTGPHTFDPSWSANGRRLLFVRDLRSETGSAADSTSSSEGSDGSERRVTNTRVNETHPSFFPGGEADACFEEPGETRLLRTLVSMRLDGTHRHRLTGTGSYPASRPEYFTGRKAHCLLVQERDLDFPRQTSPRAQTGDPRSYSGFRG